nr:RHS repeat-associated core domain-containing protein [Paenibacillus mangrovi]
MYDSYKPEGYAQVNGVNTYPEEALSYDVHYDLKKKNGKLYIDVIPSTEWLNQTNRVYPVIIDPTIVKFQPTYQLADTNIRSAFPKQTGATDTTLGVGLYKDSTSSNVIRSLIQFDTTSIPRGAKVLTADLNLWLAAVSNDTNIDVTLHGVNTAWTEYSASWMYADATNLWAKQGGDFNASQVATTTLGPLTSLAVNYKWSLPSNMVEKWINDSSTNKGLLLKSSSETTNSYKKFISGDDTANSAYSPLLSVTYTSASRLGLEDYWTYEPHPISNGTSYTNLGTGNNVIQFTDYSLAGRGNVSLDFIRTYNSKSSEGSPFGYGWSYTGSETIIDAYKTGTAIFTDADGTSHEFQYNSSSGTYSSSPGDYLTLSKQKDSNGATTGYELKDKNGYINHFDVVSNDDQVSITRAIISYEQDLHGNKITYKHATNGNLTEIIDPSGRTITFTYDAGGMVDYAMLDGRKTDYTYQNGKLITVDQYSDDGTYSRTLFGYGGNYIKTIFDPNNRLTTYTYDQEYLSKVQEPSADGSGSDPSERPATTYHYDINQHTADVTDPNGNTTYYTLNSNYVAETIKDAAGAVTKYTLDSNYNVTKITNPDGTFTQQSYDDKGNVLTETDESGNLTEYVYDGLSHVVKETDPNKNITTYTYTDNGDLETMVDPKQQVTTYVYDSYGNLKTVTNPDQSVETYSYDDKGNDIKSVRDAAGNTTTVITDSVGNVLSETDGNGNKTSYQYDKLNRLQQVTDAADNATKYIYDYSGNLVQSINAKQKATNYSYNGLNQVTKKTDPLSNITENTYDSNGNLTQTTTPNGNIISNAYTSLNQPKTITVGGQEKWAYQYNDNGELVKVNNGVRAFTYKDNGLVASETDRGNTKGYSYNANSQLQDFLYTAGTTSSKLHYDYSELDQLIKISKDDRSLVNYQYNKAGNLTQAEHANGIVTKAAYNQGNQLETYGDYSSAGTPIREYTYTYDSNGNVKTIKTATGNTSYDYDTRNQLEQETLPNGTNIHYSYDSVGNRTEKTVTSGGTPVTTKYTYNDGNQLVGVGDQEYSYDADGNLVDDGKWTYTYDAFDQLMEIKDSSGKSIFKASYDEQGRRTQVIAASGTTNYFYEGNHVIYETDDNNQVITQYVWDNDNNPVAMIQNGQTYFYHLNSHGDVVSLTDSAGQAVAHYEYDAWGNILEQNGTMAESNPYRYAGYRYDQASGLYYLMARYYNPSNGVFISLDPDQGSDLDNPLNQNGYSYALNNPVTLTDEDGNNPFLVLVIVIVVKVVAKQVVKAVVKKSAKKAIGKTLKRGVTTTAKKVKKIGQVTDNKLPAKNQKPYSYMDRVDSNNKLIQRRFYDSKGNAKRDIDYTDHGNPKEHPKVPHTHVWDWTKNPPRSGWK